MKEFFKKFKRFLKPLWRLSLKIGIILMVVVIVLFVGFYGGRLLGNFICDAVAGFFNGSFLQKAGHIPVLTREMIFEIFMGFFIFMAIPLLILRKSVSYEKIAKGILKELDNRANERSRQTKENQKIKKKS